MFIFNPNEFLLPHFGMTPFTTEYLTKNHLLSDDDYSIDFLDKKFFNKKWQLTYSGKEAIKLALDKYSFDKDDTITILTTSNNYYISSCVTNEIEKVCKWNRFIVPDTKLIFVNHEFGYPYPEMEKLKTLGLPIIEDCCTAFFSQDEGDTVGKYGDYVVYSLPKFFPTQIGGILVSNQEDNTISSTISLEERRYILNVLSSCLKDLNSILVKRKLNYEYCLNLISSLGFEERFIKNSKIIPYAMLLRNNGIIKDLNNFKSYMTKNGIQNSVFYGEDGFFIPNHQSLNFFEIQFMVELITYYIKKYNL